MCEKVQQVGASCENLQKQFSTKECGSSCRSTRRRVIVCSNMVFKFHDDPTVNESEIGIFLRQVWWPVEKRESFGRGREKKQN